jgi:hypothetical protein
VTAGWQGVWFVLPYVIVSTVVILLHRRLLDALAVGDEELGAMGVRVRRIRVVVLIAATLGTAAAVSVGGAIAFASNDGEGGASGAQADRAVQAALEATGGGTVGGVERDGESGGVWEVEVHKADGAVVDVRLDENYQVVVIDGDNETADTNDGSSS